MPPTFPKPLSWCLYDTAHFIYKFSAKEWTLENGSFNTFKQNIVQDHTNEEKPYF
jgi:hypothetical protein